MKKIIFITGFIFCIYTGHTQVLISILLGDKLNTGKIEFGLDGGANWSTIKNLDGAKSLTSFNLGLIPISNWDTPDFENNTNS